MTHIQVCSRLGSWGAGSALTDVAAAVSARNRTVHPPPLLPFHLPPGYYHRSPRERPPPGDSAVPAAGTPGPRPRPWRMRWGPGRKSPYPPSSLRPNLHPPRTRTQLRSWGACPRSSLLSAASVSCCWCHHPAWRRGGRVRPQAARSSRQTRSRAPPGRDPRPARAPTSPRRPHRRQ